MIKPQSLCYFVLLGTLSATSATPQLPSPSAPASREVHLLVRVVAADGTPASSLATSNFHVSAVSSGTSPSSLVLPVTHTSKYPSALPTKLLVLLPTGTVQLGHPEAASLARSLKPLLKRAWEISVQDASGFQTPYLTSIQALSNALGQSSSQHSTPGEAIAQLTHFPGRRVIFVINGSALQLDPSTVRAARLAGAMIYRIGVPASSFHMTGAALSDTFIQTSANGDILASAQIAGAPYVSRDHPFTEITNEPSIRAARNQALEDAPAFYDLATLCPPDIRTIALSVDIDANPRTTYRVNAQLYTDTGSPPELILRQDSTPRRRHPHP